MSAAAQPRLSVEEYLALDREAEVKSEYFDGVLYPICGVSMAHSRLSARLGWRFEERLAGSPCVTFLSPLRVRVSRTKFVYPDLFVICGKPDLTDEQADTLTNPNLVLEILSPTTRDYDYGTKLDMYRELPSVEEYVLVSQDRQRIEVFRRMPNQEWRLMRHEGPDAILPLESLNISIPLSEIFSGIVDPGARPEF